MKATSRDFVSRREDDLQPRRWSWRRRPSGASLSWREDDILKFRPYGDDLLTFRFLYCADDIRALRWPATSAGAKMTFAGVSVYPSSRLEDDIRGARCFVEDDFCLIGPGMVTDERSARFCGYLS